MKSASALLTLKNVVPTLVCMAVAVFLVFVATTLLDVTHVILVT